jgi:hypothetical protein
MAVSEGYRLPCPSGCSVEIYDIMQQCWHADSKERPRFEALTLHFKELQIAASQDNRGNVLTLSGVAQYSFMDSVEDDAIAPTQFTRTRQPRHGAEPGARLFSSGDDTSISVASDSHYQAGTPINSGNDLNLRSVPVVPPRHSLVPSPLSSPRASPSGRYSGRPQQSEGEGEVLFEHYMVPEQADARLSEFEARSSNLETNV